MERKRVVISWLITAGIIGILVVAALWLFPMDRGEWSAKDQRRFEREAAKAART